MQDDVLGWGIELTGLVRRARPDGFTAHRAATRRCSLATKYVIDEQIAAVKWLRSQPDSRIDLCSGHILRVHPRSVMPRSLSEATVDQCNVRYGDPIRLTLHHAVHQAHQLAQQLKLDLDRESDRDP